MKTSDRGVSLIEKFEGSSPIIYTCPAGKKTIGVGHVVLPDDGYHENTVLSDQEIDALLRKDCVRFEAVVNTRVTVPLNQNQFDALVCLAFNIGPTAFMSSTLLKCLNAGNYIAAAEQFPAWCKLNRATIPGLLRRRLAEKALFEEPV